MTTKASLSPLLAIMFCCVNDPIGAFVIDLAFGVRLRGFDCDIREIPPSREAEPAVNPGGEGIGRLQLRRVFLLLSLDFSQFLHLHAARRQLVWELVYREVAFSS